MSFFSRQELLSNSLSSRRASMVLFAIENRTAQLAEQDVRDAAVYLTLANSQARERDFFAALARGRAQEANVTIQQIERYAPQWKPLLPETPDAKLNAALADLLGKKYKFTRAEIPNLRAALALDEAATQQAFQTAFHKTLDTIYTPQLDFAARVRFAWARFAARLENLPPFWLAFFLTIPGAAGLLALPIAMARVGLGGGLLLLFGFALLNMFTAAALAEATARAGVTRLGLGWLGQLVQEYLGSAGSVLLTVVLALNNFFVLVIFYLGVGGTLQDATQLPLWLWMLALFGVCIFFLSRGSLNSTVASTLLIVFGVMLLLVLIPLFAVPHFQIANLARAAFVSLDFGSVQFALAVLLSTYFSHLLVATYGPVVIRRDASARAWIGGSAAAIFGFMLIASLWLVILDGALPPDVIARTQGTILTPLAAQAGAVVLWLGSLLVILSLGLATVQIALGLYYMVQERLPASRAHSIFAPPRVRFLFSILPMFGVLALAEWLGFTGAGSFASLLGIVSAFSLPLLGGVFPILLLAATRRKGEFVPRTAGRWFGSPLLWAAVYFIFVGIIFVYGVFIFQDLLPRALILSVGILTLGVTVVMLRRGAFHPRLVILVQNDEREPRAARYSIVENGNPTRAQIDLEYATTIQSVHAPSHAIVWDGLRSLRVRVPSHAARSLKIWALRCTAESAGQGLDTRVEIENGGTTRTVETNAARAEVNVPLEAGALDARLEFQESRR
jgi:amino acid permease